MWPLMIENEICLSKEKGNTELLFDLFKLLTFILVQKNALSLDCSMSKTPRIKMTNNKFNKCQMLCLHYQNII